MAYLHTVPTLPEMVLEAIVANDEQRALALIELDPALCARYRQPDVQSTLLHWASSYPAIVRRLLDAGADPCATALGGAGLSICPLDEAMDSLGDGPISARRLESIDMLLAAGALERMGPARIFSQLPRLKGREFRVGLVSLLVKHGFPLDFVDERTGRGLAFFAYDDHAMLSELHRRGAPLTSADGGSVLLLQIAFRRDPATIEATARLAPELLDRVHNNDSVLDRAIEGGNLPIIEKLLELGVRQHHRSPDSEEGWRLLLRYGAVPFSTAPAPIDNDALLAILVGHAKWSPRRIDPSLRGERPRMIAEYLERLTEAGLDRIAGVARSVAHIMAMKEAFGLKNDDLLNLLPQLNAELATTVMDVMVSPV